MPFVTPSGAGAFLVYNVLISASVYYGEKATKHMQKEKYNN